MQTTIKWHDYILKWKKNIGMKKKKNEKIERQARHCVERHWEKESQKWQPDSSSQNQHFTIPGRFVSEQNIRREFSIGNDNAQLKTLYSLGNALKWAATEHSTRSVSHSLPQNFYRFSCIGYIGSATEQMKIGCEQREFFYITYELRIFIYGLLLREGACIRDIFQYTLLHGGLSNGELNMSELVCLCVCM